MAADAMIARYLDAVERQHGREYREQMVVESRGGTAIFIQRPGHEPQILSLGQLEMLLHAMRD